MALEKKATYDYEIRGDFKFIQMRTKTSIMEDGKELSYSYHRKVFTPDMDISGAVGYGGGFAITAGTNVSFYSTVNTTYVNLTTWDATTGGSHMQESEWTADGAMMIGFSYTAA